MLRMFRLLVSSRYRRVRKCNSIWFYSLYLFIQYLKRIIHQSFVSMAPNYGDSRGIKLARPRSTPCKKVDFNPLYNSYRDIGRIFSTG